MKQTYSLKKQQLKTPSRIQQHNFLQNVCVLQTNHNSILFPHQAPPSNRSPFRTLQLSNAPELYLTLLLPVSCQSNGFKLHTPLCSWSGFVISVVFAIMSIFMFSFFGSDLFLLTPLLSLVLLITQCLDNRLTFLLV